MDLRAVLFGNIAGENNIGPTQPIPFRKVGRCSPIEPNLDGIPV